MPEILYFPHYGPNRHSDRRVIECRLDFSGDQPGEFPRGPADIIKILRGNGMLPTGKAFPGPHAEDNRIEWYASLFVQTALLLQQNNGHDVSFYQVTCDHAGDRSIALLEHEDADSAQAAIQVAVEIFSGRTAALTAAYRKFCEFAQSRRLGAETVAIIRAARCKGIPCFQLERAPLTGRIDTGFRVRRNGLLCLGHGINRQLLDGSFSLNRTNDYLKSLLRNPGQRGVLLRQLGVAPESQSPGYEYQYGILLIGGKTWAFRQTERQKLEVLDSARQPFLKQALQVWERLGQIPMLCRFSATHVTGELQPFDGMIDFDLAPDLGRLFADEQPGRESLEEAVKALLDWLYPDAEQSRIPVVAVTGTNGKTTTSRMINHIFAHNGHKTGLVCTDGIFIDDEQVHAGDLGTFQGHARVLTNNRVSAAVLETHHRGIAVHGFAFHRCDVAVCLNVTEEHLAPGEIETLEEMSMIKRALVQRAGKVAILFADDARCKDMLRHLNSELVCLVSLRLSKDELLELAGDIPAGFCVLEPQESGGWIVLHHAGDRIPVMPVNDIPATFNGTADFNTSNAMHAIAATYYSGIDVELIASAMQRFRAGQRYTPGRMNFFAGLPFQVVMDFAHNPDGLAQISRFADKQQVKGRKIIAFAGLSKRPDETNRKIAQAVSGHFDFYYCKDFEPVNPPMRRFTGPFIQQVLLEEGIPVEATKVLTFGKDVIFEILNSCRSGDLLIITAGHSETGKVPGYIAAYKEECL